MQVLGKAKTPTGKKAGPVKSTKPAAAVAPFATLPPQGAVEQREASDELDAFAEAFRGGNSVQSMMLVLWKNRHHNPEFTINVTPADLKAFHDCTAYLEVEPQIRVFRPQGTPAHPGAPATETRSAIPPRPAGKPKDYVVIQMVDQNGDAFVPIENNEDDQRKGQDAQRVRAVRENAPRLASQLIADLQNNQFTTSTITEAAEALKILARG